MVVVLTAALGAATNIGTGMLPAWRWVHSPAVIWSVVATSVLLLMVLAVIQQGMAGTDTPPGLGTTVRHMFVPRRAAATRPAIASLRPPQVTDRDIRGRDRLVDQMAARYSWRGRHRPRVNVLHGMGGAGKTTVAQLVAGRLTRAGVRVWWVSAATATQLDTGMRQLAAELGASAADIEHAWSDTGSGPDLVWGRLDRLTQRWLLVIDNADDTRLLTPPDEPVAAGRGWLRPVPHRRGLLLVTTRDGDPATWPAARYPDGGDRGDWYRLHPVGMLTPADGAAVLLDHAGAAAGTVEQATALAERLGGLPLALGIAGQTISQVRRTGVAGSPATFAGYRTALDTGDTSTPAAGALSEAQARRTIDRTWELSLDLLDTRGLPQARTLLRLLATFADAPIPTHLLDPATLAATALLPDLTGEHLATLLQALTGVGLITLEQTRRSTPVTLARLHPLIRDTSRRPLHTSYLAVSITLLLKNTTDLDADDPTTWPTWQTLAPHTTDLLSRATTQPGTSHETLVDVCGLTQKTARYLGEAGLHQSARDLFAELLPSYERVQGVEHPEVLATRHNLARWTGAAGDPAGGRDLFAELLPIRERVLGVEHPDTLDTRNHHAYWLGKAGDPAGARDLLAELLPGYERVQGVEHPEVLATRHNLAHWIGVAGDPTGSRDLFAELLPVRERVLGVEHPDTVTTRYDLAYWIGVAGDPAGARDLLAELLPVRERVLGVEHPETLATRHNLARWIGVAGDPAGARDLLAELIPSYERVLGVEHPDIRETRHNHAYWTTRAKYDDAVINALVVSDGRRWCAWARRILPARNSHKSHTRNKPTQHGSGGGFR
ncbi:tetratricopeptide repeat protein [Actinoplanes sp. L3-i22]|uniref:tetratricopeptide repeat protein n=1 Tax=Actinoplanes sp. L3-i22 TaxID=2836373 RepID=UPI001C84B20F|nr:tetratricopeptide repeat protein [Actinoplanes sp. L3-i22]